MTVSGWENNRWRCSIVFELRTVCKRIRICSKRLTNSSIGVRTSFCCCWLVVVSVGKCERTVCRNVSRRRINVWSSLSKCVWASSCSFFAASRNWSITLRIRNKNCWFAVFDVNITMAGNCKSCCLTFGSVFNDPIVFERTVRYGSNNLAESSIGVFDASSSLILIDVVVPDASDLFLFK